MQASIAAWEGTRGQEGSSSSSWKLGPPGLEKMGHPSHQHQGWSRGQSPVPGPWMCGQCLPPTGPHIPLLASAGHPWQDWGGRQAPASNGGEGRPG